MEKRKTKLSSDGLNINVVFIKTVESYKKDDELYSLIDFGNLWIRHFLQFILKWSKFNMEHEEIAVIAVQDFWWLALMLGRLLKAHW